MKILYGLGVVLLAVLAIAAFLYRDKIGDAAALKRYADNFKNDRIDTNFQNFPAIADTITIPRGDGPVAALRKGDRSNVFPDTYTVDGKTHSLQALLDDLHWHGIAVLHNDELVHEAYARGNTPETRHIQFSVTKSISAMLFGIAHAEGHIPDLNAPVTDFIPELLGTGYQDVTVQQVLDMTSGIRYSEDYDDFSSEVVRMILAVQRGSQDAFAATMVNQRPAGSYHQYASVETHVMGWILRRATGQSFESYFQEKLWSRIGVEDDAQILVDQAGQPVVFAGLNMRLRDLLRFGHVVVNDGMTAFGEQVIPREWIKASQTTDTPQSKPGKNNPNSQFSLGYKNQWWIPLERDGQDISAIGIFGQFLYLNPDRNVVIAVNSAYPRYYENSEEMEEHMLAAMQAIAKHLSSDH